MNLTRYCRFIVILILQEIIIHVLVYSCFAVLWTIEKIINHKDSDRLNNYYKILEEVFPREFTHYDRVNKKKPL
jgi:hypothetical protein